MRQQKKLLPRINMVKTLFFLSVVTVIFQSYPLLAQIDKFDMILHISSLDDTERIVFGDANGRVHILEGKNGQFEEVWFFTINLRCGMRLAKFTNWILEEG